MQSNDSQQIVALMSKVIRRRKLLIGLCVLGILIPIIIYNETATPTYEASTMIIFEEFSNPVSKYVYDDSREILLSNRLEEIKSLAFSEDIARALSPEVYAKFELPEVLPPNFDKFTYISSKINRSISAYSIRGSNIIQLSVEMSDPQLCVDVANTAAQVFQERIYKVKQEGVSGVRSFIEEQLKRFSNQLDKSEEELKKFKEANKIISIDKESQGLLTKMTEAEVLYNSVKSNRGSVEERLATIQDQLAQQKKELGPRITDIATPYTQKLKEKLVALQQQYTELRVQGYSSDHPKLVQIQNDIEQTKKNLTDEALKIAHGGSVVDPLAQIEKMVNESYTLQVELETLKAQEQALAKILDQYERRLATLPSKEYELARLTRDKEVNDKIYMMLLEKREEAKISEAEKIADIRVIDKARLPWEPVSPNKKLNIVIGLILGTMVGFGMAFVRERMTESIDSSEELEKITGWPVVASIPAIDKVKSKFPLLGWQKNGNDKTPSIKSKLISEIESKSVVAETYRMLRTNLQFLDTNKAYKTILVTSIGPDEGKSTTLTNLSITLASMDQRVLMIDADLRRPILHSVFELDKEPGLSDLLVYHNTMRHDMSVIENSQSFVGDAFKKDDLGDLVENFSDFVLDSHFVSKLNDLNDINNLNILNNSLMEAIQATEVENLNVLTSGKQLKNPSETVANISMKAILEELKKQYDVILIDSAPIMLVPETMVMSSFVDGVLFVVDSQKYNKEMLLRAKNILQKTKAKVLGAVLNNVEVADQYKDGYYYYDSK